MFFDRFQIGSEPIRIVLHQKSNKFLRNVNTMVPGRNKHQISVLVVVPDSIESWTNHGQNHRRMVRGLKLLKLHFQRIFSFLRVKVENVLFRNTQPFCNVSRVGQRRSQTNQSDVFFQVNSDEPQATENQLINCINSNCVEVVSDHQFYRLNILSLLPTTGNEIKLLWRSENQM
ncbi:hypothetical protein OGAPHI_006082 [Ogataea philodendri]|uniref:Uncharacterized protein n=1 Tax=Ogataea philodendri TaxID=1378263 RepID=A0A9P8NXU8_9ASCO|nr:uncharacterized protein OGAPHI_006082 [Ogataea philodendri]KAH3661903.1 hypothetical protein OGAPHI_006082 [Ogataea philodendri]